VWVLLNIHFPTLFLDGVYVVNGGQPVFRHLRPPDTRTLEGLIQTNCPRVGAYLERQGLLVRDIENTYLELESKEASAMDDLLGHSISYRIAVGSHAGRKAFTLQTIPAREDSRQDPRLAKASGFSILWSVRGTSLLPLLTLCRCRNTGAPTTKAGAAVSIHRPPGGIDRTHGPDESGECALYETPYRDGTTHIISESLDFIARLAALVPNPRVNLTRFHGVFAPNSALRQQVTPARRGRAAA
jgi:hypothetical protein